jgi:DNA-directed RNA polymerase specialized sigma24 family protein
MESPSAPREALALVREIGNGSLDAWSRFVETHARLIQHAVRRYLPFASEDEQRDAFVEILAALWKGGLQGYDGRSRLSTWLFLFARSRCIDRLRARHGRHRLPRWLVNLPLRERRAFELYFVEGRDCAMTRQRLAQEGLPATVDELAEILLRLEHRMDERMRRRLAQDLAAGSVRRGSARMMRVLQEQRIQYEEREASQSIEFQELEKSLARMIEQLQALVDRLPDLERAVIAQRYYLGKTARETARELCLRSLRLVYTIETRAVRMLRSMLGE